jgi:hypothetical protein
MITEGKGLGEQGLAACMLVRNTYYNSGRCSFNVQNSAGGKIGETFS